MKMSEWHIIMIWIIYADENIFERAEFIALWYNIYYMWKHWSVGRNHCILVSTIIFKCQHFQNTINLFMPCLFEDYWKISCQVKVTWYCKYVSQMKHYLTQHILVLRHGLITSCMYVGPFWQIDSEYIGVLVRKNKEWNFFIMYMILTVDIDARA